MAGHQVNRIAIPPEPKQSVESETMTESYDLDAMVAQLMPEEGERFYVYDDATGEAIRAGSRVVGNPTAGIGRNLASEGLTDAECRYLCANDVARFAAALDVAYPWWRQLSPSRQRQIIDLTFNMGLHGLAGFPMFLAAMQRGDWAGAVADLKDSAWWGEVGQRGPMIVARILVGGDA